MTLEAAQRRAARQVLAFKTSIVLALAGDDPSVAELLMDLEIRAHG